MTDVLSRRSRAVLNRLAKSNLLIAFDYDGTLAPIVPLPERAFMRPTTRLLLKKVAQRYPCVVISGRARADLVGRLRDVPVVHVSGNHGLEPWAEAPKYMRQVQTWMTEIVPRLAPFAGVVVEDKGYSISIHYRAARERTRALAAIDLAVRELSGARRIGGKQVVNLVPDTAPGRGVALERVRRLLVCDAALYVGDDDVDEGVFASRSRRVMSVRVGPVRSSHAPYLLKNQRQIDGLLRHLVALRPNARLDRR